MRYESPIGLLIFSFPGVIQLIALIVYISTNVDYTRGAVTGLLAADLITAVAALLWIAMFQGLSIITSLILAIPFVFVACTNTIALSIIQRSSLVIGFLGVSVVVNILWVVLQALLSM